MKKQEMPLGFYKMQEFNLFTRPEFKGRKIGSKKNPKKANNVMRVGGRRISASSQNKVKYIFPVEISYK